MIGSNNESLMVRGQINKYRFPPTALSLNPGIFYNASDVSCFDIILVIACYHGLECTT